MDGCKAGWFYFALGAGGAYEFGVVLRLEDLLARAPAPARIFVDMPIGLLDEGPSDRGCDGLARACLGPRAASVFPAPKRSVLACASYLEANARERRLSGKGLSRQTYGLFTKLREVDFLMRDAPLAASARRRIRESHPEVCFWAMAGQVPMRHPKKTDDGFVERLAALTQHWPHAEVAIARAYLWTRRSEVARDDIFDALALGLTARLGAEGGARALATFPPRPRRDAEGLKMEMVYGRF